jgi:hypothetical protein
MLICYVCLASRLVSLWMSFEGVILLMWWNVGGGEVMEAEAGMFL